MSFKKNYPAYYENIKSDLDVHPSETEIKEFEKKAKEINPKSEWTTKGCIECVAELFKFVFENEDKTYIKANFPLNELPSKKSK